VVAIHDRTVTLEFLHEQAHKIWTEPTLFSVTESLWSPGAIELFRRGRALERIFWANPQRVGFGTAYAISASGEDRFTQTAAIWDDLLRSAVIADPGGQGGPMLFGGFAFDPTRESTALWQSFPAGRMALPELMFTFTSGETWLTTNLIVRPGRDPDPDLRRVQNVLDLLLSADMGPVRLPKVRVAEELRQAGDWQNDVAHAAAAVGRNELEKVVLARAIRLRADGPFDEAAALERLIADFPGCKVFAIGRGDRCFLGATPERLVAVQGDRVQTMVLAGSARRGQNASDDDQQGHELLASSKNRHEHAVVLNTVLESLRGAVDRLEYADTPGLLKLGNVQHLCTPITGHLSAGGSLMALVQRLHPTPAVGGRPRETALALIRVVEDLDRGWYAGPVGCLDYRGEGEFAVALRSALVANDEAILFAGCGIMADSDPLREYEESGLKFRPMLSALGA